MSGWHLALIAGTCACCSAPAIAQERPPLQRLGNAIYVEPIRVAHCRFEGGELALTTEWSDYGGGSGERGPVDGRVFDCFGDEDSDGVPDDFGGCGMGEDRWFFGTSYCNWFVSNDMADAFATEAVGYGRADFGWYWTCGGFGTEECLVAIFTQESNPDACEADSGDHSGWLLDFGDLSCNPGGYYYTNADISSRGTWPAVADADGSYVMYFLTSSGSALATCAQPMLWGTSDGGGAPTGPGTQGSGQLDDDNPVDGTHDTISECYTYSYGVCPDPLGPMLQFWGQVSGTDCFTECNCADCNGDATIDIQDFLCFLGLWVSEDPDADCNRDDEIDTQDFLCFLSLWSACR